MNELFFIIFAGIAVSYGWGMRGTIIGGEKGAMVPGALMGLAISAFSGCKYFYNNPLILAGVGAVTMFCGGNMTYADTLWLTMKEKNPPNFKKNMFSLFLRGGLWFGLFGGYTSLFISSASGFYKLWQVILFFCLLPVFALVFYYIFNKPYDKEKKIFPKIYFSVNRKETWGGLLGMLLETVVFSLIFKDWSALTMTVGTFLAGGIGWVVAQFMQIAALLPNKKGKVLFNALAKQNYVDAWKIMECVLGFIGGALSAVVFVLSKPLFTEKFLSIDKKGIYFHTHSDVLTIAVIALFALLIVFDNARYFVKKANKKYLKICSMLEFPLYGTVPFMLSMLGFYEITKISAFALVLLVLCEEIAEKFDENNKANRALRIIYFIPALISGIFASAITPVIAVLMYTVIYEIAYYVMIKIQRDTFIPSKPEKTVHIYFTLTCLATIIMSIIIF